MTLTPDIPNPSAPSDESLVAEAQREAARQGSTKSYEQLVQRYQGRVLANCRHLTSAATDVEELAHEIFVKAYFALPQFEARSQFYTWLYRIKANHCINHNVSRRRREPISEPMPEFVLPKSATVPATGLRNLMADEQRDRINRTLDGMTETLRVPLMLRDADGLTYDEIAALLRVSLSAVKMRINRGRLEFRQRYRALDVHDADLQFTHDPDQR